MTTQTETLGDALPKAIKLAYEMLNDAKQIGPPGVFYCANLKHDIELAEKAISEGDTVAMIRCYKTLSEYN